MNKVKIGVLFLLSFILIVLAKQNQYAKEDKTRNKNNKYINYHLRKHTKDSRKVQRFMIPKSADDESIVKLDTKPEEISIVKKSGAIKDSELPGAFGEDNTLTDQFDDGDVDSGSGSGSGEHEVTHSMVRQHFVSITHDKKAENAANFGNNVIPKPGINPSAAFITEKQNNAGFTENDNTFKKKKKKNKEKKNNKKGKVAKTNSAHVRNLEKKKDKSNHSKDLDIVTQIKNIEKKINEVERKNGKKHKSNKSKNLKEKVSSYIKQLENDITNEIQKDDASEKHGSHKANVTSENDEESAHEEKAKKKEETKNELTVIHPRVDVAQAGSPDGFECPWVCFWTCHSYCPKECCNNPYNCKRECKEFCTPYCSDKCCAPGSRRMPKLKINFQSDAETGKKDRFRLLALRNKTLEMQKAQNETNLIAKQLEALKQASFYAAQALGLPDSCPLFCPQICTPGLCKPECCARSATYRLPRIIPNRNPPPAPQRPALPPPVVQAVPQPQQFQQVGKPAPVPGIAQAATRPAAPQGISPVPPQLSSTAAEAIRVITQGTTTADVQSPGQPPLQVVSSYIPLSPSEMNVAANMKGEQIGQFSITQPNGQIQTFNVESGPVTVMSGATTNEQIKTEQTAYMAPDAPIPPQTSQRATQRYICPTPINCPDGATVDPDYCPPICRTACIDQCPNECCPNNGRAKL